MSCFAFCSAFTRPIRPNIRLCPSLSSLRGAKVASISMSKKTSKRAKRGESEKQPDPSTPPADASRSTVSAPDLLKADVERIRAKRKNAPAQKVETAPMSTVKSVVDSVLIWNFFLVLGLLGWLGIALIPHFASKNDVLLDPWLALWQPFIQPVLGVLMLGTIVQGSISYINSKE
ncbi:unnamed protein product [Chondrus crispus]|uniref:Uncharacterized protein n=1 Tax=Chondrus crispus TaxID=2769 RepID=R7QS74_CHOCR|nr:unnamed protein product [Chondrus crispus]CDF41337.1 unnamed protein product [Chondrus crispus]|eukprot:XP_005711631.1 unnamed protein product [Chondrus crispus]